MNNIEKYSPEDMGQKIDSDTRYYIDLDIGEMKVIGWDYGQRQKIEQELPDPNSRRIFITKGQYNKLNKQNIR